MEDIIDNFIGFYYTTALIMVCSFIAFVTSFIHREKIRKVKFFFLYPLSSFLQGVVALTVIAVIKDDSSYKIILSMINIFILLELVLIYYFFYKLLNNNYFKWIVIITLIGYSLYFCYTLLITSQITNNEQSISLIQSFLILLPCIFYFIELFNTPTIINLSKEPTFWIASGILINFSCLIPIILIINKIEIDTGVLDVGFSAIMYLSYSLLFLLITGVYLCTTTETQ